LHKSRDDTNKYILDTFPYRVDLKFLAYVKASKWIKDETNWVNLMCGFAVQDDGSINYELRDDADYALWMVNGDGKPPTLFFRDVKHAIWFKLNWVGKEDGQNLGW
jgi:hypothetical protein